MTHIPLKEYVTQVLAISDEFAKTRNVSLVIAGGAAASAICKRLSSDVDFFFVSAAQDVVAARELLNLVLKRISAHATRCNEEPTFTRNENVISVCFDESATDEVVKLQFILRLYPSVSVLLGGFDLGPCAVALLHKGKEVVLTRLGAWCLALVRHVSIRDLLF